jgi:hypothetical protein
LSGAAGAIVFLLAAAAADTGGGVSGATVPNLGPGTLSATKPAETCVRVIVEAGQLVRRADEVVLKVSGRGAYAGMRLQVRPVVYVMQPDYWLMTLVGCVPEGTPLAKDPVHVTAEVDVLLSLGRKGIDLDGDANGRALRLELPV